MPWAWVSLVGVTVWWTLGLQHRDLPGRPQGHQRRALRGGVARRRRRVPLVLQRDPARAAPGDAVHDDHHHPRVAPTCSASRTCSPRAGRATTTRTVDHVHRRPGPRRRTTWRAASAMSYVLFAVPRHHQHHQLPPAARARGEERLHDPHDPADDGSRRPTPTRPPSRSRRRRPRTDAAPDAARPLRGARSSLALIIVLPLLWMLLTSFKTDGDAIRNPYSAVPNPFSTDAYADAGVSGQQPIFRWLLNSSRGRGAADDPHPGHRVDGGLRAGPPGVLGQEDRLRR